MFARSSALLTFACLTIASPLDEPTLSFIAEASIPFTYEGATYATYTKIFGSLLSGATPLVVLHGGPGLSHDYLLPIADLAKNTGTPIIFYDQIGNARSTHLDGAPESFWTIDLFVAELENVVSTFGISGAFNVLGHSWGGVLATEYVVQTQPEGLQKLVLSDTLPSAALWGESLQQIVQGYSEDVQQAFAVGMADPSAYQQAIETVYADHGCILKPWPQDLVYSFSWPFNDTTVASAPYVDIFYDIIMNAHGELASSLRTGQLSTAWIKSMCRRSSCMAPLIWLRISSFNPSLTVSRRRSRSSSRNRATRLSGSSAMTTSALFKISLLRRKIARFADVYLCLNLSSGRAGGIMKATISFEQRANVVQWRPVPYVRYCVCASDWVWSSRRTIYCVNSEDGPDLKPPVSDVAPPGRCARLSRFIEYCNWYAETARALSPAEYQNNHAWHDGYGTVFKEPAPSEPRDMTDSLSLSLASSM
jgi:pimeloyl-ACP methyl ester carboxylesterase